MDKISELLQEAKPLYLKKQREKRFLGSMVLACCLCVGVFLGQPQKMPFNEDEFDSYFTALYLQDTSVEEEPVFEGAVPLNRYGLYEV